MDDPFDSVMALLHRAANSEPEPEDECSACGGELDGDCDHCCRACLGGETCPACEPVEDC